MKLVVATNNAHKLDEIKAIFGSEFECINSLKEVGISLDVDETADSFTGNAALKARAAAALLPGYAVLADDSGLCVNALNGAPGVYSARFSDDHDDASNRRHLLELLKDVPEDNRDAYFACAMVLVLPNGSEIEAYGTVEGRIAFEERGENGFGYDSLFYYEPAGVTFAELPSKLKNKCSHRFNALMMLLGSIRSLNLD